MTGWEVLISMKELGLNDDRDDILLVLDSFDSTLSTMILDLSYDDIWEFIVSFYDWHKTPQGWSYWGQPHQEV